MNRLLSFIPVTIITNLYEYIVSFGSSESLGNCLSKAGVISTLQLVNISRVAKVWK